MENELNFKLQKERELITELTKEQENLELSITEVKKELKDLKAQKKDVLDRIKTSLSEVYSLEKAIKMDESK